MRHLKHTFKVGRTSSHRKALLANLLKDLIMHGRIETTLAKAKELRRYADRMITFAKKDTLAARRTVKAKLMLRYNALTRKESRRVKEGDKLCYNTDRKVLDKLFGDLKLRYMQRAGGYTRIVRLANRVGDDAPTCIIEYVS
jgi:large subunit ribosomal protein L17